ncbi:hypothetical protein DL766_006279 [Monosporascus sp. MC13-8B]|uniref:Required for respiratory growth protein 9, mitochondrial n=1 Tax=Monosporascus cannonballus TaxID=155416 RepID=A0ABY0HCD0_9PEZI|nr:hypothetical protein DL762_003846 [Monosporascus cannonballus]RYO92839.1 hypothetical protein DL763_004564 [Monosporascus cannonballus]RYP27684.1 hypothetical protein DL766_006279 [Monosporascus sp. MC13-8B]
MSAAGVLRSSEVTCQPVAADISNSAGEKRQDGPEKPDTAAREEPPDSTISASAGDLDQAKQHGVILDLSPESLDSIIANLNRQSNEDLASSDEPTESGTRSKPEKPAIESSKLKRRKIIKEDPKKGGAIKAEPKREHWQIQKEALKQKFPEGWQPRKRLSPDAVEGIRALHAQFPEEYPTEVLARRFEVSPEAIRRILRSRWRPSPEEDEKRQQRWFNRGKQIWGQMAALGRKPPKKWRREGIVRDPSWNVKRGPRTEWPYMPHRPPLPAEEEPSKEDEDEGVSPQRKLSETLL